MSRSSRQKRNRQQYAVSLFPFLAVLVCTLGVLIVMLVMAVQQADVEGRQEQDEVAAKQQQLLQQAQDRRELAEFESASILSVREDLTTRLRDAKGDRSYLEQQIKNIDRQAKDLLAEIAGLNSLIGENSSKINDPDLQAFADRELDRLRSDVAAAKESLEQLREDKSFETKPEYAIIPFTGSGGTRRQPIFVECVSDGLVLQPYNIKLNREDFGKPLLIGNMLDSALLTIREYWEKHGLSGPDSKPYPLLVVRPDGADSYGLARRAMKSWDDEFGYELVGSDVNLRFGQPDLKLKTEIEAAIELAKRRQQKMARQRQFNRDDQFRNNLQLARGLKPSSSGGFEFTDTGRPAHELFSDLENVNAETYRAGKPSQASFSKTSKSNSNFSGEASNSDQGQKALASNHPSGVKQPSSQSPNQQSNGSSNVSSTSLANTRGANWALPTQTTGARAYIRPIRLICEIDKVSIVSQNVVKATIPLRKQTVASIDPLVSEVWKAIESWGLAGRQAYWKPELRFSVVPGAERRFEELQALLDDSGLLVEAANER